MTQTLTLVSPLTGTVHGMTPIVVDVSDDEGLQDTFCWAVTNAGTAAEDWLLAYVPGQFSPLFRPDSTFVDTTPGITRRYSFLPANGWPAAVVLYINEEQVALHAPTHILGAADEIDGDQLGLDFVPTHYTRTIVAVVAPNVKDLTAHLKGLDTAVGVAETDAQTGIAAAATAQSTAASASTAAAAAQTTANTAVTNAATAATAAAAAQTTANTAVTNAATAATAAAAAQTTANTALAGNTDLTSNDDSSNALNTNGTAHVGQKTRLTGAGSGGFITVTLKTDANDPSWAVKKWAVYRYAGTGQPKFVAEGGVTFSEARFKITASGDEVVLHKIAANTYELGGAKSS